MPIRPRQQSEAASQLRVRSCGNIRGSPEIGRSQPCGDLAEEVATSPSAFRSASTSDASDGSPAHASATSCERLSGSAENARSNTALMRRHCSGVIGLNHWSGSLSCRRGPFSTGMSLRGLGCGPSVRAPSRYALRRISLCHETCRIREGGQVSRSNVTHCAPILTLAVRPASVQASDCFDRSATESLVPHQSR